MSTANQESLNLKPKEPYKAPFDLSKAQFPNEIQIIHGENYSSKTISKLRFKKGDVICKITQATEKPKASWVFPITIILDNRPDISTQTH